MDGQEGRGYMRKLCGMSLLILALLFPFPVFAAGQEKVMGMVQFQCMVDLSLDGQTMELVFEEQDTGEEVTVSSREYKSHAITAQMPVGTYRLSAIRFNDNLYFDYRYSCSPETFSVTGEEQTEPVYVFAVGRSEAPKAVTSKIVFSGQEKFSGTVQITLHAVLDVYYGDTVTYRQEDYSVTSVGASEKTVDRNAMQKPEIALLVGEQDTAGTELVCKAAQEMDAYRYVADQKMELPYDGCDRPDSGIFRGNTGIGQKSRNIRADQDRRKWGCDERYCSGKTGHQKVAAPCRDWHGLCRLPGACEKTKFPILTF